MIFIGFTGNHADGSPPVTFPLFVARVWQLCGHLRPSEPADVD